MDKAEAQRLLRGQIEHLRKHSYEELRERLDQEETFELQDSGTTYQLEVQVFWDGRRDENLRVVVAIDEGGWRAFAPLTSDFIIASDGSS
jgi:hypothetical protein